MSCINLYKKPNVCVKRKEKSIMILMFKGYRSNIRKQVSGIERHKCLL